MAHDPAVSRTLALVTLLRHHGNGVRTRQWLEAAGDPITALERAPRKPTDEGAPGLPAMATAVDGDLAWLAQPGRHLLSITDPDFPPLLRDSGHAPAALWIEGDPLHLWQPQIAIVGARNATPSGIAIARDFSRTLANAGFCITSGLADGIDAAAHIAALDAGAATVAVCGTGLSMVYPRRHVALAQRLIRNGAQVSEFAPDTGVRAAHFPRRNRIIAGISLGTLVVEAGLRSGSLVTARLATEQGREVFAIPGSIHNPLARGCHRLIRDGATLVEDAGEVIAALVTLAERLGHRIRARLAETSTDCTDGFASRADPDQSRVLEVLTGGPADVDALVTILGLAAGRVSAALVLLQVEGMVAQSSGGHWMRVGPVTGQTSNGSVCGGSA